MNNNINIYTPPLCHFEQPQSGLSTLVGDNECRGILGNPQKVVIRKVESMHSYIGDFVFSFRVFGWFGKEELSHTGLPLIHPVFKIEGFNVLQM
jgi:hypothetical protein